MRTDRTIGFRTVGRSDKQLSSTARVLEETFVEDLTYRALSKEEVLSKPFLLGSAPNQAQRRAMSRVPSLAYLVSWIILTFR
jgi:hypothetical protein